MEELEKKLINRRLLDVDWTIGYEDGTPIKLMVALGTGAIIGIELEQMFIKLGKNVYELLLDSEAQLDGKQYAIWNLKFAW